MNFNGMDMCPLNRSVIERTDSLILDQSGRDSRSVPHYQKFLVSLKQWTHDGNAFNKEYVPLIIDRKIKSSNYLQYVSSPLENRRSHSSWKSAEIGGSRGAIHR